MTSFFSGETQIVCQWSNEPEFILRSCLNPPHSPRRAARRSKTAINRFEGAFWKCFLPQAFATLFLLWHQWKHPRQASAVYGAYVQTAPVASRYSFVNVYLDGAERLAACSGAWRKPVAISIFAGRGSFVFSMSKWMPYVRFRLLMLGKSSST